MFRSLWIWMLATKRCIIVKVHDPDIAWSHTSMRRSLISYMDNYRKPVIYNEQIVPSSLWKLVQEMQGWYLNKRTGICLCLNGLVDPSWPRKIGPGWVPLNLLPLDVFHMLTFRVRRMDRNFRLSPISIQLLMQGNRSRTLSSIKTGGMFSPPAVMINSEPTNIKIIIRKQNNFKQ